MNSEILESYDTRHLKNNIYFVPKRIEEIGENAFAFVDKGTNKQTDEDELFAEGGDDPVFSIKRIVLPEGIKKIGAYAFFDTLLSLTNINIPSSLEEIGDFAFWGMDSLKKIYLTPNIKKVGRNAFCNCPKLTIYFKGKQSDIPKGWHKDWNSNCKVKYETKKAAAKLKRKELKVKQETKIAAIKSEQKKPSSKIQSRIQRQKLWRAHSGRLKRNVKQKDKTLDFSNALPILRDGFEGEPCYFSLAEDGPHLENFRNLKRSTELNEYIKEFLEQEDATWALSDSREERKTLYNISAPLVHVGVDIIAPAGTPIYSPFDAKIIMVDYDDRPLGYGWYCALQTIQGEDKFYLLFGHLSGKNFKSIGTKIKAGEQFAQIGNFFENGRWFHHTHFQVLTKKAFDKNMFGAFIDKSDLDIADNYFPSPLLVIDASRRKTKVHKSNKAKGKK